MNDSRIVAAASAMMEAQMLKIISEMKQVTPVQKTNFTFDELQKAMSEFGVGLKRPAFISEKAPPRRPILKAHSKYQHQQNQPEE